MEITRQAILKLLYDSIDEVNQQLSEGQVVAKADATILVGSSAALDSLAFVNFIAAVEDGCERRFGCLVSLADAGLSETGNVRTLGDLADALQRVLPAMGKHSL